MLNLIPAKILSYDAATRTAQVHIDGLTDGAEDGLTATFAYPVGHDDRDTEIQVLVGAEVYVFFAGGQLDSPVIAFYRSHGEGAVVDTRRIRQKNIEILAALGVTITAPTVTVDATTMVINADLVVNGNINHIGNQVTSGSVTAQTVTGTINVIGGGKSLVSHGHIGVRGGNDVSGPPV
jgi:phage baseplate assembly protein gpV